VTSPLLEHWAELERIFAGLLNESTHGLKEDDRRHIAHFVEHNEFGVAFDTLLYAVTSDEMPIDLRLFESIDSLGRKMKLDSRLWEPLRSRVVD
jgi:hypothetical protein